MNYIVEEFGRRDRDTKRSYVGFLRAITMFETPMSDWHWHWGFQWKEAKYKQQMYLFLISAVPHAALTILRLKRHFLSPVTPVQYGEHSFMAWKVAGVFTNEWIQLLNCFPTSVCPLKRLCIQTSVVQSRGHWGLRALHSAKNTPSAASKLLTNL